MIISTEREIYFKIVAAQKDKVYINTHIFSKEQKR